MPKQNSHPISGCWESQGPQDPPYLQPYACSVELLGLEYHAERPCCSSRPLGTSGSTGFWCQFYKKFAAVPNVLQNHCVLYEWSEKCLGRWTLGSKTACVLPEGNILGARIGLSRGRLSSSRLALRVVSYNSAAARGAERPSTLTNRRRLNPQRAGQGPALGWVQRCAVSAGQTVLPRPPTHLAIRGLPRMNGPALLALFPEIPLPRAFALADVSPAPLSDALRFILSSRRDRKEPSH